MTKVVLEYKRISPNESIARVKDSENNLKVWRHRYVIKNRTLMSQEYKDYSIEDYLNINDFQEYIEELPREKGQMI
jgi:hypothetical protein